ncbi:MAG: heme o synthase [Chthoniobacterales bacterium]
MKSATVEPETSASESFLSDLTELVKARLSLLVLCTTFVGYLLGLGGAALDYVTMGATLIGTALCAGGAAALNQWWERDFDAGMKRTRNRPLPAGRLHPQDALMLGLFFSGTGVLCLGLLVNWLTAILAAVTIATYVLVYTPMKRFSALNTLVGAVPGALPPLLGWTAATGQVGLGGWVLFGILWFWQMPHFLAIAWMYKDEYAEAGFVMLTGRDADGFATGRQSVLYAMCLLLVSLVPGVIGLNTSVYFYGALILGLAFLALGVNFLRWRTRAAARLLFFGSIIYLPLLLGLLVGTRSVN